MSKKGLLNRVLIEAIKMSRSKGMKNGLAVGDFKVILLGQPDSAKSRALSRIQKTLIDGGHLTEEVKKELASPPSSHIDNILCNHLNHLWRKKYLDRHKSKGEKGYRYVPLPSARIYSGRTPSDIELAVLRRHFNLTKGDFLYAAGNPKTGIWIDKMGKGDEMNPILDGWIVGLKGFLDEECKVWDKTYIEKHWAEILKLDERVNRRLRRCKVKPTIYATDAISIDRNVGGPDHFWNFAFIRDLEAERLELGEYRKESQGELHELPSLDGNNGFNENLLIGFYSYVREKAECLPSTSRVDRDLKKSVRGFISAPLIIIDMKQYKGFRPDPYTCPTKVFLLERIPSFPLNYLPQGTAEVGGNMRIIDITGMAPEHFEELFTCLQEQSRAIAKDRDNLTTELRSMGALLACWL